MEWKLEEVIGKGQMRFAAIMYGWTCNTAQDEWHVLLVPALGM